MYKKGIEESIGSDFNFTRFWCIFLSLWACAFLIYLYSGFSSTSFDSV